MAETSNVKISPPEVFVEFCIICIQKLEVMCQGFWTEKEKKIEKNQTVKENANAKGIIVSCVCILSEKC